MHTRYEAHTLSRCKASSMRCNSVQQHLAAVRRCAEVCTHRPLQLGWCRNLHSLLSAQAHHSRAARQHHARASVELTHNPGVGCVGVVAAGAVGFQHRVHHLQADNSEGNVGHLLWSAYFQDLGSEEAGLPLRTLQQVTPSATASTRSDHVQSLLPQCPQGQPA